MAKRGNGRKPHDSADYRARRKLLMDSITPRTRCGRCGKLFHEHPRHKDGTVGRWEVGHVLDAVTHGNLGPLRIEHSVCNRQAGGRLGYSRGIGRPRTTSGPSSWTPGPHLPQHYELRDPEAFTAAPCLAATGKLCATCAAYLADNPGHR
jgi:hypothetical protein